MDLLADELDDFAPKQLSINKQFADKYKAKKQGEELSKLKDKYGEDYDPNLSDESDSSDESEDEEGEQVTPDVDAAILRTLARIRTRDAAIYEAQSRIFDEERKRASEAAASLFNPSKEHQSKSKRMTLKDYHRQQLQELVATSADPAAALAEATSGINHYNDNDDTLRAPVKEEADLRAEVTRAFHEAGDDGDDDDGFLVRKDGVKKGASAEDENPYRRFLLESLDNEEHLRAIRQALRGQMDEAAAPDGDAEGTAPASLPETHKEEKKKKKGKSKKAAKNPDEANEEFLLNYILNRGWIDESSSRVPSYDEITRAASRPAPPQAQNLDDAVPMRNWDAEAQALEEEDEFDEKAEEFENRYNFRFEEGNDAIAIPSYARDVGTSVRRVDDTRKRAREERKSRKEEEKAAKMAELARFKNLKKREIVEKLKQLREATGSAGIGFDDVDLEADFDPDAHDKQMQGAFDDGYYEEGEDEEMEKPTWDDDIDISDILGAEGSKKAKAKGKEAKAAAADDEDGPIEMDADFLPGEEADVRGIDDKKLSKKEKKKLKKKLKAAAEAATKRASGADGAEGVDADMDANVQERRKDDEDVPKTAEDRKRKLDEMMDEYYKLDYEDMIGDQPTRFKYTKVNPSNYGLTPVEILLADDAELNKVVGIKQMQPYRRGKGASRPKDLGTRLREFRSEFTKREGGGEGGGAQDGSSAPKKKRLGRKERIKSKAAGGDTGGEGADGAAASPEGAGADGERPRKKEKKSHASD